LGALDVFLSDFDEERVTPSEFALFSAPRADAKRSISAELF
jgi:hypothetical protein